MADFRKGNLLASQLQAATGRKDGPMATFLQYHFLEKDLSMIKDKLDRISIALINSRPGCVVYAFTRSKKDSNPLEMIEIFSDLESQQTHLTENEGEVLAELFHPNVCQGRISAGLNVPEWHEGVQASFKGMQAQMMQTLTGHVLNPYPKTLLGGKYGERIMADPHQAFMLEFRMEMATMEETKRVIDVLRPLLVFNKDSYGVISKYLVQGPGWWRRDPTTLRLRTQDVGLPPSAFTTDYGSDRTIECRLIFSHAKGIRHEFKSQVVKELVSFLATAQHSDFIMTAENWKDEALVDLIEYFTDHGLHPTDQRELLSGFLLHPRFTKAWKENKVEPVIDIPSKGFHIRRHVIKNTPEAVVVSKTCRRKTDNKTLSIPLLDVLRKFARIGHIDSEVPYGMVFGILERLRHVLRESTYANNATQGLEKEVNMDRITRFFDLISSMGHSVPSDTESMPQVECPSLQELVDELEAENASLLEKTRQAIRDHGAIEYMGLQEVYPIGSVVTSRSIQGLSGLLVSFTVLDSYFEPLRSLMGALKYGFRLTLETVLNLGGTFIAVPFHVIIPEWTAVKDLHMMVYEPSISVPDMISHRLQVVSSMGSNPTFQEYRPGCFFPQSNRRNQNRGAASSSVLQTSKGKVVVDSLRGLQLGYSPASRADDVGEAISNVMKTYRQLMQQEETTESLNEKLKFYSIYVYSSFPRDRSPWPTAVGFSVTLKSWGFVIIDHLKTVQPNFSAWNTLVLPPMTKEMLLALSSFKAQGAALNQQHGNDLKEKGRYRYRDVIEGKGMGALYLLHGPPGTGKTLTVEALASYYAKPLYSISFAELGTSAAELEERLTDTLQLASHWGCFVLLDEGDALVEKRTQGQFQLNSMTGVLLKILENFTGSLFITSNRAAAFDPAALSRVTLAIQFHPLTKEGLRKVWHEALYRILESDEQTEWESDEKCRDEVEKRFDLDKLSHFPGSGRSIGAVLGMAIALCTHRSNTEMKQSLLDEAIATYLDFHTALKEEGVSSTWSIH